MDAKGAVFAVFLLLLVLVLVTYYVGTTSDILSFGKAVQQIVLFLSGQKTDTNTNTTTSTSDAIFPSSNGTIVTSDVNAALNTIQTSLNSIQ